LPSQSVSCSVSPAAGGAAGQAVELADLLPHLRGVTVEKIECTPVKVVIGARWWPERAACLACGIWSSRVHSSYVRQLHDSPVGGRPVLILYRFKTHRMAPDLGVRKISYAAW
jgi:hypothetical protein